MVILMTTQKPRDFKDKLNYLKSTFEVDKAFESPLSTRNKLLLDAEKKYGERGEPIVRKIKEIVNPKQVLVLSSWNYSNCFLFVVNFDFIVNPARFTYPPDNSLFESKGKEINYCEILVSAIFPEFLFLFHRISFIGEKTIKHEIQVEPFTETIFPTVLKIEQILENFGLEKSDIKFLLTVIPEIKLEMAEKGQVKAYNCIYLDSYDGYVPIPRWEHIRDLTILP